MDASRILIRRQKRMASVIPEFSTILVGKDFREDEAENCLTHETIHILIFELEGRATSNLFDKAVILYYKMFGEHIEEAPH